MGSFLPSYQLEQKNMKPRVDPARTLPQTPPAIPISGVDTHGVDQGQHSSAAHQRTASIVTPAYGADQSWASPAQPRRPGRRLATRRRLPLDPEPETQLGATLTGGRGVLKLCLPPLMLLQKMVGWVQSFLTCKRCVSANLALGFNWVTYIRQESLTAFAVAVRR